MTPTQGQGEVKSWTIPEIVISLCDNEPRNDLTTAGNGLVPSCQYTCFSGQNIKNALRMEKSLTDSHHPVPSVENITSNSVGEEVVPEKKDVKNKEKALTDNHLPVASVGNITLDLVGDEVVTKKQHVKEEVKKCCRFMK